MFGHMCSIQEDSKLKEFKDFCVMRMAVGCLLIHVLRWALQIKIRRRTGANPYLMSRALLRRWSVSILGCMMVSIQLVCGLAFLRCNACFDHFCAVRHVWEPFQSQAQLCELITQARDGLSNLRKDFGCACRSTCPHACSQQFQTCSLCA